MYIYGCTYVCVRGYKLYINKLISATYRIGLFMHSSTRIECDIELRKYNAIDEYHKHTMHTYIEAAKQFFHT
jgi:hypothetical protein